MTVSHSLSHRRAAAAAQRRQLAFDPSTLTGLPFESLSSVLPVPPDSSSSSASISSTSDSTSSTLSLSSSSTSDTSTTPSTTSSSSTPPPTTSSTPTPTTSTTPPPLAQSTTTLPQQTAVVTQSVSRTVLPSSTSAAPSSADNADTSSGMSTGAVIGGIGAGIVAILVIGFVTTWLIRRRKRDNDGGAGFDAPGFRHSAMILDDKDEPAFNPRPPTMIERHLASPAPTFGTQYGAPGPTYNDGYSNGGYADNRTGYGAANNYPSFGPGQVMDMHNGVPSPISATSAHPMYSNGAYGQNPFSPVSQHGHYPQEYNESGLSRQPSNASGLYQMPPAAPYYPPAPYPPPVPVLTRQGSNHSSYDQHPPAAQDAHRESLHSSDYVDLSRSSVSPFQAEQYVEISRRLNTEVPEGLKTADIDRDLPPIPASPMNAQYVNNNNVSPFSDPASAPPSPGGQYAIDNRHLEHNMPSESTNFQGLEFPAPPSPIHPLNSAKSRVDSMPPMLPEINVESRVSVGNYPGLGARDSNALGAGLMTPSASRFPTTPSPLASSFGFPSPGLVGSTFEERADMPRLPDSAATGTEHVKKASFDKKRSSMHSVYDAEDAYGGF